MSDHADIDWESLYATRAGRMRASEIRELLKVLEEPDIISFAGGIPDPALFPSDAVREACAAIFGNPELGRQALQYSTTEGYLRLRRWIAEYMGRRGVPCDVENIVITSGSQQGLDFLGKLLLSAGDTALVTAPTYLGALHAFNAYEPRYDTLHFRDDMPSARAYQHAAQAAGGRVAFAYVVPDFANPSGETVSERDRARLLDLTNALGVPLIEDAAYEALRFEGEPVPACLALDVQRHGHIDRSRVIYCGTFSKTISPGLRVGWICANRALIHKLVLVKQAADLHSAPLNQMVMHRVAQAVYEEQIGKIMATYSKRRDAMLAALERHMPAGVSWTRPEGGMFVWVTLPASLDGADLLAMALREERVAFVPGGAFFADGSAKNTMRLNYSLSSEAVIDEGVQRLGRLVARHVSSMVASPTPA
jgi:DNA-binding transcriptional MocR family regulator